MASLTVVGVFDNASEAQQAVDALVSDGFSRSNIDLSTAKSDAYGNSSNSSYGTDSGAVVPDRHKNTSGTAAEEVVDDTKDVGDSIGNFFSSLFGGSDDADKYKRVAGSSSVVTVHTDSKDEAERAADILDDNGAVDVNEKDATYGTYGSTGSTTQYNDNLTTTPGAAFVGDTTTDKGYVAPVGDNQTIKVVEEKLEVGKREVETGGVRLRSRIVERPVEENLRLREERVTVQRTPVNRPATEADLTAFQDGQVEVRETAERAVVSKTANVVEEISVGKEVNERDEVIRDTVRKTEVDVENLPSSEQTVQTDRTTGFDTTDTTYSTK